MRINDSNLLEKISIDYNTNYTPEVLTTIYPFS
jgi:hypothetical protein